MINFINNLLKKDLFLYFLIFLFCIYSISISNYQGVHVYDGFHWGLVTSSAYDFLNGKIPYKESFIHYGLLTTIIHSIFYKFTNSIISIFLFTSILYVISITLVTLLIKKFTNNNYCYLFIYLIFFFQPFTVYPWHTYIVYFFLSLGLYIYFYKNLYSYFFFGLILQLAYLSSESFKLCSYAILIFTIFFIFYENKKNNHFKFIISFLFGYFFPLLIFLATLYSHGIFNEWINHNITGISLKLSEKTFFILILDFIRNLINNFYKEPVYIFYLILNFSCLFFIFLYFTKKKIKTDILFISIITLLFNYILIHKFLSFRIFSSVVFGFIVTSYLLFKNKNNFLKEFIILFLILLAPLANPFEKGDANKLYLTKSKANNNNTNFDISHFKYMRFNEDINVHFSELLNIVNLVELKCNEVSKFYNLTSDHFYYLILSDYLETEQIIPGYDERSLWKFYTGFTSSIDKNFYKNINRDLLNENSIFIREIINNDHLRIINDKVSLRNYAYLDLPYSYHTKFKRIYIPKKCADLIY